jgi:hypothetical protein
MFEVIEGLGYRVVYKECSRPLMGAFMSDACI